MLRINEIKDSAAAKAYYKSADYYLEGHEHPAYWHGEAAERLGLSGPVGIEQFHALCDNQHPETGATLTAARGVRRIGYDFTFSVPKSASLAYALGQDDRLADAFRGAVAETMAEVEREMATRVRKGKRDEDRRTGNMAWCDFLHTTSRPINGQPDPQLHVHAVAFNLTWDRQEGEWKAGQFGNLKAYAPYFQSVFRSRLATRLQGLGYDVRRTRDDFEIVGVPERTVAEFSRRTAQIEKLAGQLGIKRPETKAKLGATSREKKSKGLTWPDLIGLWTERLKPGEKAAIDAAVQDAMQGPLVVEDRSREAVDWALAHLLERKSVVPQRAVVTEALKHGLGSVTPESVYAELGRRRDLIRRDVSGVAMVSTQGVLAEEKRIVEFAVKGRGRSQPLHRPTSPLKGDPVPPRALGSGVTPDLATLSPTQQAAVRHVWSSPDRLILIRGAAGTGKTHLTKAVLAGVDVPWVILAPSAEASRGVLRRDGFESADTLAKFLLDQDMQEQERVRGGLIWLDEASLAGAHDVYRLVQLADSLNARVVLSGDRRQHKSVARGDVLALLEDRAGLPVAEVSEIRRQAGEYKSAVAALAKGDVAGGFARLDALGWIKEASYAPEAGAGLADVHVGENRVTHAMIADDYVAAVRDGKTVLVVSPTHAEGEAVTAAIREKLKQEGRLKGGEREFERFVPLHWTEAERADASRYEPDVHVMQFHRNSGAHRAGNRVEAVLHADAATLGKPSAFSVCRRDTLRLMTGDVIRITANGKTLDGKHKLNNGAQYTVAGFTDAGHIRLDNGWVVGKDFGHLAHGYAVTSHASQGKTVDRVLIAQGSQSLPASSVEQFYVSVSRGRQQATVYTDDKAALLDAVRREDTRMLATDLVRRHRGGVREKLKKHLAFLRRAVRLGRDRDHDMTHQPEREHTYERT